MKWCGESHYCNLFLSLWWEVQFISSQMYIQYCVIYRWFLMWWLYDLMFDVLSSRFVFTHFYIMIHDFRSTRTQHPPLLSPSSQKASWIECLYDPFASSTWGNKLISTVHAANGFISRQDWKTTLHSSSIHSIELCRTTRISIWQLHVFLPQCCPSIFDFLMVSLSVWRIQLKR